MRDIFQSHHSLTSEREDVSEEEVQAFPQKVNSDISEEEEAFSASNQENLNERSITSSQYDSDCAVILRDEPKRGTNDAQVIS